MVRSHSTLAYRTSLILVVLLWSVPGCDDATAPLPTTIDPRPVIVTSRLDHLVSVPYLVDSVAIRGRTLAVRAQVAGGCMEHTYDLYVSNGFAESYPVQTWAYLVHQSEDPCEALLHHRRQFDLQPLLDAYVAAYGSGSDPIIIHVYADPRRLGPPRTVRYQP